MMGQRSKVTISAGRPYAGKSNDGDKKRTARNGKHSCLLRLLMFTIYIDICIWMIAVLPENVTSRLYLFARSFVNKCNYCSMLTKCMLHASNSSVLIN